MEKQKIKRATQLRFYYRNKYESKAMLVIVSRSDWGAKDKLKFLVGEDKANEWKRTGVSE